MALPAVAEMALTATEAPEPPGRLLAEPAGSVTLGLALAAMVEMVLAVAAVAAARFMDAGGGGGGSGFNGQVGGAGGAGSERHGGGGGTGYVTDSGFSNTGAIGGGGGGGGQAGGGGGAGAVVLGTADGSLIENSGSIQGGGGGGGAKSGGGGGSGIVTDASLTNTATGVISGGGGGGAAGFDTGGGGGGAGVVLYNSQKVVIENAGQIIGGSGGKINSLTSGAGGGGGAGIFVSGQATGSVTIRNSGTIIGGDSGGTGVSSPRCFFGGNGEGGARGSQFDFDTNRTMGAEGGAGIVGQNLTIVNSGEIRGAWRARAIILTGGANSLTEEKAESGIVGGIEIRSGASLTLDQDANDTIYRSVDGFFGTGELIKTGAAKVSLTTASNFTGDVLIDEGTLATITNNVFNAASLVTVNANGTFDLGSFSQTIDTLVLNGGTLTNGRLTGAVSSNSGTIDNLGGAASVTVSGVSSKISGSNTYTGVTDIVSGSLVGQNENAFSAASVTTVDAAGTLDLGGFTQTIDDVRLAGGTITNGALAGAVTATGGSIIGLEGTASVTLTGGALTMSGANSYTGDTLINAGILWANTANAFSETSRTIIASGGVLDLNGYDQAIDTVVLDGGGLTDGSLSGAIVSNGGAISSLRGSASLTVNAGVTRVTDTNTFNGATLVQGGSLVVDGAITDSPITVTAGGMLGGSGAGRRHAD